MSDIQPSRETKKTPTFTRRNFIDPRFWLSVAAGTYVAAKGAEQALYKAITFNIDDPNVSDASVRTALKISEQSPNSENKSFRSMDQIINEGISGFVKKTGKQVFYKRSQDYRDKDYYINEIEELSKFSLELPDTEKIASELSESFPPEAKLAYYSSDGRISTYEDMFDLSSGMYSQIEKKYPEQFDKQGNVKDFTEYFSILRVEGKQMINKATSYIEVAVKKEGKPVSASVVLEYFLSENDRDLAKSIYDTHLYLKFMSRNNRDTGFNNPGETNVKWMINNIKDEYQGPSFIEDEKDVNNIGKPYHSWNLVAMLQFFPVELIRASGIYRQVITLEDQGLGKTRSDLQTLNDLRVIEKVLLDRS